MKLYIDLLKAEIPSRGKDTPPEDQSRDEYESSYGRRYEGVAAGEANDPDHPEVGNNWQHDEDDSVVADAEEKRAARKKGKKDETKKSLSSGLTEISGLSIMESVNKSLTNFARSRLPSPTEQEFLREVLGYSQEEINKGVAVITGRNRRLFNRWLCDRMHTSTDTLVKSIGGRFV